jgi:hypothetical protein
MERGARERDGERGTGNGEKGNGNGVMWVEEKGGARWGRMPEAMR